MSLNEFARYPLLFGPSPVHKLERLTSEGVEPHGRKPKGAGLRAPGAG